MSFKADNSSDVVIDPNLDLRTCFGTPIYFYIPFKSWG